MASTLLLLEQRPCGHVAFDTATGLFEITMLTTSLDLDQEQLRCFGHAMEEQINIHRGRVCPHARLFVFTFGYPALRLVLSMTELRLLAEMLDEAMITHAVHEVIGSD